MSHLGLEVLRGLAATKLGHLNHTSVGQNAFASSLSSERVLQIARLSTAVALMLLWFAGELERFALGKPLESESSSEEEEQDVHQGDACDCGAGSATSHPPNSVRCRWCREEVICEPDGEVFDLNHKPHRCSLRQVPLRQRRPSNRNCSRHAGTTTSGETATSSCSCRASVNR